MSLTLRASIPNAITVARLLLAIVFFVMVQRIDRHGDLAVAASQGFWAAILFGVAAATDVLDGYLARRWSVLSVFGRLMDPLVDKILVLGGFVYLASDAFTPMPERALVGSGVAAWMVVVVLLRELMVTGIRSYAESRGIAFGADIGGKIKMVIQSFCVPWCVFVATQPEPSRFLVQSRDVTLVITMLITVGSAVSYVRRALRLPPERTHDSQRSPGATS